MVIGNKIDCFNDLLNNRCEHTRTTKAQTESLSKITKRKKKHALQKPRAINFSLNWIFLI
ncbi:hypothetical protein BpHYR1_021098 [Brachionus plicatilis]|uniref:Uncharacterized protein n=1 Tax=Brachionus plicatilis TaxID=10195 RepID=A0A3M7PE50_BRAPC|nr:hypothetical protein BpHYR1_021098 [Brachionus plicatilis]